MNGFYRIATASPELSIADPRFNAGRIIALFREAVKAGSHLVLFPELSLTGYSCADLFGMQALEKATEEALGELLAATRATPGAVLVVGLPLRVESRLFNCAAVIQNGTILGIVPKTHIPNYREFYEKRQFISALQVRTSTATIAGIEAPFGTDLLFKLKAENAEPMTFAIEICEDLWSVTPPSAQLALAGAELILNLSASTEAIAKADFRRDLVRVQSARLTCCYAFAGAGVHESTTDVVFSGHLMIAANGRMLNENARFERKGAFICGDFSPCWLQTVRRTETAFNDTPPALTPRVIPCQPSELPPADLAYSRLSAAPFVPADASRRRERCQEIFRIQAAGLAKRFTHTRSKRLVIGLSGGLDSTLALLVCMEMCRELELPSETVLGVTLPGFGTGERTKGNVEALARVYGVDLRCIEISPCVSRHFEAIGHDPEVQNVVYENAQARERTQILMDIANGCGGIVVGTGDLSEIALGWSTFNGDHMSMYNVNCSVPKTLIRHIIETCAVSAEAETATILRDIIATPVSPELLPGEQHTEAIVGQYDIHDFYLYYFIKYGCDRTELLMLAQKLLGARYDVPTLETTLNTFLLRFISQQFKRSSAPDGPKVGSIALSPRGDWRMPSDASDAAFLA